MTKFRHLIWMLIAAGGLILSASQSQAQMRQPDVGDQPGAASPTTPSNSIRSSRRRRCSIAPTKRRAPSSWSRPSAIFIWSRATAAHCATASASAVKDFTWQGLVNITRKAEWPDWTPPPEMIARQPYLPRFMAGGPGNPLGARAMYLGTTVYRIHGTNRPDTIGTAVSSGCFRLVNADVADLYERVPVGTKVIIRQKPEL